MMNPAEHPLAIDMMKRISVANTDDKSIPVQIFFPGMGQMMGACRASDTPGLFILVSNVAIGDTGQQGVMEFYFTCDKPLVIIHPDLTETPAKSRIIQ